jgi:hypothetical protein
MSSTVLYAAEVPWEGALVHVLGYQNVVANGGGLLSRLLRHQTGNAMILPFPAEPGSMTEANVVATEACPNILQDMSKAVSMTLDKMLRGPALGRGQIKSIVQVFSTGIYTVVLAQDARAIPGALHRVPSDKRPALHPKLFDAYAAWYPEWTIALCCFNNRRATLATPLLWWYRPMNPERLFAPALDCHTGKVPDLRATVKVDHAMVFASPELADKGLHVSYEDDIPATVAPFVSERVIGSYFHKKLPNGDFVCDVADVRRGLFSPRRELPPAA